MWIFTSDKLPTPAVRSSARLFSGRKSIIGIITGVVSRFEHVSLSARVLTATLEHRSPYTLAGSKQSRHHRTPSSVAHLPIVLGAIIWRCQLLELWVIRYGLQYISERRRRSAAVVSNCQHQQHRHQHPHHRCWRQDGASCYRRPRTVRCHCW